MLKLPVPTQIIEKHQIDKGKEYPQKANIIRVNSAHKIVHTSNEGAIDALSECEDSIFIIRTNRAY